MTDYRAFIALVNREDLLRRAVESSYDVLPELTVIDNSPHGITFDPGCKVFRAPMPIQFSHSMNYAMLETRRQGAHICLWMHCDAWAPEGAYMKMIEAIHGYEAEGRKWGVVFTNYDALVAINTALIDDVGLWDNNIPWYFSDNDFLSIEKYPQCVLPASIPFRYLIYAVSSRSMTSLRYCRYSSSKTLAYSPFSSAAA